MTPTALQQKVEALAATAPTNNPDARGRRATDMVRFGPFGRYALYAIHTRWNALCWFVTDAETEDDLGFPTVVRQAATPGEALVGLPLAEEVD